MLENNHHMHLSAARVVSIPFPKCLSAALKAEATRLGSHSPGLDSSFGRKLSFHLLQVEILKCVRHDLSEREH